MMVKRTATVGIQSLFSPLRGVGCLFLFSLAYSPSLSGKNLGIQGELFPIEEENLFLVLQERLSAPLTDNNIQSLIKQIETLAKQPRLKTVPPSAKESRVFYYDPTFTVQEPIKDSRGTVIATKGTKINPLSTIQLCSGLLFFDGENPDHLQWAREQKGTFRWILVQGNPFDLEKEEIRPVYFDQNGFFLSRFDIRHIPARVTQEGLRLKVEEICFEPKEDSR